MSLKLNKAVLATARAVVDRSRKRLIQTGVMLDAGQQVVVRDKLAIHCNRHRHSDRDLFNLRHAPEWKALREDVLTVRGPKCQNCSGTSQLAMHHRYYFSGHEVWEYDADDLLILCKICHSLVHNRTGAADLAAYYQLCWQRLREVEREIKAEEITWEIECALGYHSDPTLSYDEDNPGYWEEEFGEDPGDLADECALGAQLQETYEPLEDD